MTRSEAFCPRCGAATTEEATDERPVGDRGLCRACYLEALDLVDLPGEIAVERCPGCGSIRGDDGWRDVDADPEILATELVTDHARIHAVAEIVDWTATPRTIDGETVRVACDFLLVAEGARERVEMEVDVAFSPVTCDRCRRIASRDFGSVVQVRARRRPLAEGEEATARQVTASVLEDRVEVGDRDAFLTDVIDRPEGIDFRLSSPRLGQQVATAIQRRLGGELDASRTLVSTDSDGQEVYRVTHRLRLPRLQVGDIVDLEETAGLVVSVDDRVGLLDLKSGERRYLDRETLVEAPIVSADRIVETTVVSPLDDRAMQIIDPATAEAVTVARYAGVARDAETVEAVRVDDELYVLPHDR